jgi:hypothetical protein
MIGPLKNLHFFDFRHITSRFFEELRTMFFGTNFYFLSFVREGYQTALLSQRLIAHGARSQRISRSAGNQHEAKRQDNMRKSTHWSNHQKFVFEDAANGYSGGTVISIISGGARR